MSGQCLDQNTNMTKTCQQRKPTRTSRSHAVTRRSHAPSAAAQCVRVRPASQPASQPNLINAERRCLPDPLVLNEEAPRTGGVSDLRGGGKKEATAILVRHPLAASFTPQTTAPNRASSRGPSPTRPSGTHIPHSPPRSPIHSIHPTPPLELDELSCCVLLFSTLPLLPDADRQT